MLFLNFFPINSVENSKYFQGKNSNSREIGLEFDRNNPGNFVMGSKEYVSFGINTLSLPA